MCKIGLYGGTFDPIHLGHLITSQIVLEKRALDEIIFMPCNISPHKTQVYNSDALQRLEMVKLAVSFNPKFTWSDFEIKKSGISYSINTIKELKKEFEKIELIIGYDNLVAFDRWHQAEEIVELVDLVVLKRKIDTNPQKVNRFFENAIFMDTPNIDISSSLIRERTKNGLSIDYFVPNKVRTYILQNKLYKE